MLTLTKSEAKILSLMNAGKKASLTLHSGTGMEEVHLTGGIEAKVNDFRKLIAKGFVESIGFLGVAGLVIQSFQISPTGRDVMEGR